MKLAIMQPYFLPYIGYFQLMKAVDIFVVYDNIKYTKKGWINRNRMLVNGRPAYFTLPLKHGSDALNVCERMLADNFEPIKLLNQLKGAYAKAPFYAENASVIEQILLHKDRNLFGFIYHSLRQICAHLEIGTPIEVSSRINIDHNLSGPEKVLAICTALGVDTYVNPIGGVDLYSKEEFQRRGIELQFLRSKLVEYPQFGASFVPGLSIVDVMMFNPRESVQINIRHDYDLL